MAERNNWSMRKTVSLEDNVVALLRVEVERTGESRKVAINRLLRKGLQVSRDLRSEEDPETASQEASAEPSQDRERPTA